MKKRRGKPPTRISYVLDKYIICKWTKRCHTERKRERGKKQSLETKQTEESTESENTREKEGKMIAVKKRELESV